MLDDPRDTIDALGPPPRRRSVRLWLILALLVLLATGTSLASYYVEALWFGSLGYEDVFWKTLNLQGAIFGVFAAVTFVALYGSFLALKPAQFGAHGGDEFLIVNGRPVRIPVGPVLRVAALIGSAAIALGTGAAMMEDWPTFALWWYGRAGSAVVPPADRMTDPIFGRPIAFYLFTLPTWDRIAGWLMTLAVVMLLMAIFFAALQGGGQTFRRPFIRRHGQPAARGLGLTWAFVLLMLAAQVWLGRFERLFDDHTVFAGVTYTEAHVTVPGMLIVSCALALGAAFAAASAVAGPRMGRLAVAILPAAVCYIAVLVTSAYVNGFIVKPNELVREQPYIANNITFTRQAYGLNRIAQRTFPAEATTEAADLSNNQATLQNIRLWDWRVLQDTLRQLQEIRTYYDFPDIDIDRYTTDGALKQAMLAARELNVTKLPVSSRNWINEKLIYTHGYGVTMNYVNGFTPEGLPVLLLKDMPVQSAVRELTVTRPEIYFGETTDTDVYVNTRQQEFNYPQGQTNNLTSYQGSGGIVLGGLLRRLLIAFDRGDIGKLPFSDDVTAGSRLLMRRNVRERVSALAPFLTLDADPYIVLGADGRLSWLMDAFTVSDRFPCSRAYRVENVRINYVRNSIKVVVDAYNGTTTFYVFDEQDPVIAAYRGMFPSLFKSASAMPADLRAHIRYPELLLALQADVYGLYHMTNPAVFYNREDLWAVATDVASGQQHDAAATSPMEPNFVLMTLPGEHNVEFVEVLPFSPANRNNLIGWIAGRSDGEHYGELSVYDFPKTRLVDGPLQVEARIDQNAQLSGQLSLWNQQGSHVRRGGLLVIPIGRALLYAEAIFLQAERSPMPELRLVVLAMQDRLAYAPTFEAALQGLFGASSQPAAPPGNTGAAQPTPSAPAPAAGERDVQALIARAAKALSEYQRLTAEGRLGEAGQKLEELKRTLDELNKGRR